MLYDRIVALSGRMDWIDPRWFFGDGNGNG